MLEREAIEVYVYPDGTMNTSEGEEEHTLQARRYDADRVFVIAANGRCTVIKDRYGAAPKILMASCDK